MTIRGAIITIAALALALALAAPPSKKGCTPTPTGERWCNLLSRPRE